MSKASNYLKQRLTRYQENNNNNNNDNDNNYSPNLTKFRSIQVYETQARIYLFGRSDQSHQRSQSNSSNNNNPNEKTYRLIKLDRDDSLTSLNDIIQEDDHNYSWNEVQSIISTVEAGETKGFISVTIASVLLGFVKFLQGYYLILGTKKILEGTVAGHNIYSLESTIMMPIWKARIEQVEQSFFGRVKQTFNNLRVTQTPLEASEKDYRRIFNQMDFTKDFFFSYTYDITRSIQSNYLKQFDEKKRKPASMYIWNHFLINEFQNKVKCDSWFVEFVYGSFEQQPCLLFGEEIRLTVIARRSRHFAGTRYLKRGISDDGKVANDVEVEQIIEHVGDGRITSHVQNRGSIPVFWTQKTSATDPKPDIILAQSKGAENVPLPLDPFFFSTRMHLEDMISRYGAPITCLNLVRLKEKKPREILVGSRFREAIQSINITTPAKNKVTYLELDYKHLQKAGRGHYHLDALAECAETSLKETDYFLYNAKRNLPSNKNNSVSISFDDLVDKHMDDHSIDSNDASSSKNNNGIDKIAIKYYHGACKLAHVIIKMKDRSCGTFMFWEYHGEMVVTTVCSDNYSLNHIVLWKENDKFVLRSGDRVSTLFEAMIKMQELTIGLINRGTDFHSPFEEESVLKYKKTSDNDTNNKMNDPQEEKVSDANYNVMLQAGVLRVNCIDCLDRTNVAQFYMGLRVLGKQLWSMGIDMRAPNSSMDAKDVSLDDHAPVVRVVMLMYERLGDRISMQYAGSQAHKKVSGQPVGKDVNSNSRSAEVLTSIRRYYSNSFTDKLKQDAINLVLGHFIPSIHTSEHYIKSIMPLEGPPKKVWERDGDYYWHNKLHLQDYVPSYEKMSRKWWSETPLDTVEETVEEEEEVKESDDGTNSASHFSSSSSRYTNTYECFDDAKTYVQLTELAIDHNRHGRQMCLSKQLEEERAILSLSERGLDNNVLHWVIDLLKGNPFVDIKHDIIKTEFPLWKDDREYEKPYTSLSKDGEFIINQPSWDPYADTPPVMEDVIFGKQGNIKFSALCGSAMTNSSIMVGSPIGGGGSLKVTEVRDAKSNSIMSDSKQSLYNSSIGIKNKSYSTSSVSDNNFMISNQNTIGKHNNKEFLKMLRNQSIDYSTLTAEEPEGDGDIEEEDDIEEEITTKPERRFSFFNRNPSPDPINNDNDNSKTALGFDTLTKQVYGKYKYPITSNDKPLQTSDLVTNNNNKDMQYNKPNDNVDAKSLKKEFNKGSVSMIVEDDYLIEGDHDLSMDKSMLDSSNHSIDTYKIGDESVGIYKSYVAIDRYTDACYENDSNEKIFDVTGLRQSEIENYSTKYSTAEEFLFESKERGEYYNKPERIMKDYMKNLLVEEY